MKLHLLNKFKILGFLIFIVLICSCRDYINVNPDSLNNKTLLFTYDSLNVSTDTGLLSDQTYYENSSNTFDSIRVDFTGSTNIDTTNSAYISIVVFDQDNNIQIGEYSFITANSINQSYSYDFVTSNVYSYIVYFNISLNVNHPHKETYFLKMKNLKVWGVY